MRGCLNIGMWTGIGAMEVARRPGWPAAREAGPSCREQLRALRESHQIAQSTQPDFFAAGEWLAIGPADRPAPVARPVAHVIEDRWRGGRPALDQLRVIAGQGAHFRLDVRADVEDECGARVIAQMDAEVVEDARRVERFAGEVSFSQLRPEPRRIDESAGGDVVRVG